MSGRSALPMRPFGWPALGLPTGPVPMGGFPVPWARRVRRRISSRSGMWSDKRPAVTVATQPAPVCRATPARVHASGAPSPRHSPARRRRA